MIASAPNGSISEIEQLVPLFGFDSEPHRIISINNSNGVGIVSMTTSPLWYCNLYTDNSNSWIHNYIIWCRRLFLLKELKCLILVMDITLPTMITSSLKFSYNDTSPAQLTFQVVGEDGVGLTTNPGIAKTFQSGYATIVNKNDYPDIKVIQERSKFIINEALL